MISQTLKVTTATSSAFSDHDWSDLLDVGGAPPTFHTVVSALTTVETDGATFPSAAEPWSTVGDEERRTLLFELGAHSGHGDHTNRSIAITRSVASRSERSDVLS